MELKKKQKRYKKLRISYMKNLLAQKKTGEKCVSVDGRGSNKPS